MKLRPLAHHEPRMNGPLTHTEMRENSTITVFLGSICGLDTEGQR